MHSQVKVRVPPLRAQSPGTLRPMLHGVSCYPVCPIKPNINITERPNPTFQLPLCSLEAPAQLHTKPRHGQAGHGHYTTHGLAGLFGARTGAASSTSLCASPRQEGDGRKPSEPQKERVWPTWAAPGDRCELWEKAMPCRTKIQFCSKKPSEHALGFSRILPLFRLHSQGLVLLC